MPVLLLQLAQQPQDLGLHGDVQGGGGFVGDQQLRPAGQGDGDVHALGHAAGDLVRVGAQHPVRVGDLDLLQQLDGPGPPLRLRTAVSWTADDFRQLTADGVASGPGCPSASWAT